jgi:single-strand DNA-binding protein
MSHATIAISGTIGKDAEVRELPKGGFMARFNVATNGNVKNQNGGYDDVTTWFRVTYFARSDKWMAQFLKGAKVFVTGELMNREYTNRDGQKVASLEITATHAESLSPRQDRQDFTPAARPAPAQRSEPEFDTDIPF